MVNHNVEIPLEIIEKIIRTLWTSSNLSSSDRILFMTTCPLLNKTWKSEFSRIASRDVCIPRLGYLLYLTNLTWNSKLRPNPTSLIYNQHTLRNHAQSISFAVDLRSPSGRDTCTENVYWYFTNFRCWLGLRRYFPSLQQLRWQVAVYAPRHLWTLAERPQVVYTQIILELSNNDDDWDKEPVGAECWRKEQPTALPVQINVTIQDPDAYLGVTDALWKYCTSPLAGYLGILLKTVMGDLITRIGLPPKPEHRHRSDKGDVEEALKLGRILLKSRRLSLDSDSAQGGVHSFSTTTAVNDLRMRTYYFNRGYTCPFTWGWGTLETRCPDIPLVRASHSVCTPLCFLRMPSFWCSRDSMFREGRGWALIVRLSEVTEVDLKGSDSGMEKKQDQENEQDIRYRRWCIYSRFVMAEFGCDCNAVSGPRAVEDLQRLVESGIGYNDLSVGPQINTATVPV
ncbi:hypothetical protein VKT23_010459 [Stygiomarasmius scandens]|uniref:F-box domain-containing protein n=1 Tax=Marasmiellus scandens TaxID=2682957 RepID=A0ABR1JHI2_9AGAR